jgi:hypothetical protein
MFATIGAEAFAQRAERELAQGVSSRVTVYTPYGYVKRL